MVSVLESVGGSSWQGNSARAYDGGFAPELATSTAGIDRGERRGTRLPDFSGGSLRL